MSLVVSGCDLLSEVGAPVGEDVDLHVEDGRLTAVCARGDRPFAPGAEVLDARGLLAIPGLVNAHTHSPENALRGVGAGRALEPWLCLMFAAGGSYSPEDHYACALAGAAEMLRTGTTAVIDHLWMTPPRIEALDATMRAYRDAGMRAAVAPLVDDDDSTPALALQLGVPVDGDFFPRARAPLGADELVAFTDEAMRRWHRAEHGRLSVLAGPAGVQWCSDELLAGLAQLARTHGTGIHLHLLETRLQERACRLRFGASAAHALDALGALGPHTSLPHSVWLDEQDVELLAERRAVPVHNPAANLRLGSGRAPIRALLDAGVRVALGTDGSASSDNQVLFDQVKLAALVHTDGTSWVGPDEALRMATLGGAAALGLDAALGTLAPGRLADLALIDRRGDGLAGAHDVPATLALSETGRGVRHVVVAGEIVVRDGRCTRFDDEAARDALAQQARRRRAGGARVAPDTERAMHRLERLREAVVSTPIPIAPGGNT